jgi:hypothetical protein
MVVRELSAKNLIKLRKQAFEELCGRLLDKEYEACFEPDAVEIQHHAPEDFADGGRDLEVEVHEPPVRRGHWSLLPRDAKSVRRFSCKTAKDEKGRGWKDQVREDIDPIPRIYDARSRRFVENPAERAHANPKPPLGLLEMLASGGSYWILINIEGDLVSELEAEAALRLGCWIEQTLGRKVDLTGRIKVKDATFLAKVFNERPFTLSEEQAQLLDVDEPDYLYSWEQWSARVLPKRRIMAFHADNARAQLIASLDRSLTGEAPHASRVVRLAGPPGVGKTRLVHYALGMPVHTSLRPRIRYSTQVAEVLDWLERGSLTEQPDMVLVLDEVAPHRARVLQRIFEGSLSPSDQGRLILIGPQGEEEGEPTPTLLGPIEQTTFRTIVTEEIESELHQSSPDVASDDILEEVLRYSEGYPLYAMWLARALVQEPTLLERSGSGLTDGEDPWCATAAVLAGTPAELGTDRHGWKREAELRGKALLLVLLVPDEPWDRLEEHQRARLVEALAVPSWDELRRAAKECKARGLLRDEPQDHYYISPANLEYLVLDHFFGGSGDLDPEPLRRNLGVWYERLLHRAAHVRVSERCKQRLARIVLERIERPSEVGDDELIGLELAAFLTPQRAALAIDRFVEARGASALASDGRALGRVCRALDHLRHRRLASPVFQAVERALFSLAVESADSHPWSARPIWASLFRLVVHQTHQAFSDRLVLLQRRVDDPDPRRREVALDGVVELMDEGVGSHRPGWDDVDGSWGRPSVEEALAGQSVGSQLLLRLSDDTDAEVARIARSAIARRIGEASTRPSVAAVLDALPEHVMRWTPGEHNALRDAFESSIERARQRGLPLAPSLLARFDRVLSAMSPTSLSERIVAQVGRGTPAPLLLSKAARLEHQQETDQAIARELAGAPDALRELLPWLTSDEAVRAAAFGHALGMADDERHVLAVLLHARADLPVDRLLTGYMAGWSARAGADAVDHWLESHVGEPGFASLIARSIVSIGGSDGRARLLVGMLHRGVLQDGDLSGLGFWGWHESVSLAVLDDLILELAGTPQPSLRLQGLGLMARRLERSCDGLGPESRDVIHTLLLTTNEQSMKAVAERDWVEVARRWRSHGDVRVVRTVLLALVHRHGHLAHAFDVLTRWLEDDAGEVWRATVDVLGDNILERARRLAYAFTHLRVLDHVPAKEALAWIGDDEGRAAAVACWTTLEEDALDSVTRALIHRFGPEGAPGRLISDEVVPIGSEREDDMLERAARWACDPEPDVAAWASSLRERLEARAALRRRRGYA